MNLQTIIGTQTTQVNVGQFDIQFTFGEVAFQVESRILLVKNGSEYGTWEPGKWPDKGFYEIMNTSVTSVKLSERNMIQLDFENGIRMELYNDSEEFETLQIRDGDAKTWIM